MQLTHKVTVATKEVDDGTSDEDLKELKTAGWDVSSPPPDDDSGSSDEDSGDGKGEAQPTTQDEVDTGHAGLQVDEGASVAESGDNPSEASEDKGKGGKKK